MAADIRSVEVTESIYEYMVSQAPPDAIYEAIAADTAAAAGAFAGMQIGAEQYAFLRVLTKIVGVDRAVEVGTFTGTSAVAIASGLQPGGTLVCCDISEEWTAIAARHWKTAGVDERIDLRLAPALDTLSAWPADEPIDFAFIDADKGGYIDYYEAIVPRLRSGGVIVADNVLWSGRVVDPAADDADTEAIRAFNAHVVADRRTDSVMLPVGDGITIARKS